MNNIILQKRHAKKVIGMTVGYTEASLLLKVDTEVKFPLKVIGMTVGFDTVKICIPLLKEDDLKRFE